MGNQHDMPKTLPSSAVIQLLPIRVVDGRCSSCGTDLSALAEEIQANPNGRFFCTGCGVELRTDEIEVGFWKCEACGTPLIEFGKDTHCHGCGKKLIYPEGTTAKK